MNPASTFFRVTKSAIDVANHVAYRNENYAGLPHQDAHHEWLLALVEKRTNRLGVLAHLFKQAALPIEKIRSKHGDEVADRVLEWAA